ncbi:sqd [Symbiodinium sp. CCMP2592]|nr:sqd [Symbiodinium sp. CCMP2592]
MSKRHKAVLTGHFIRAHVDGVPADTASASRTNFTRMLQDALLEMRLDGKTETSTFSRSPSSSTSTGSSEWQNSSELTDLRSSTSSKLSAGAATSERVPWENKPLSAVSTNAGATPSLDDQSRLEFSPASFSAAPTPSQDFERNKAVPPSQVRKVFVGRIPQDLTRYDLCATTVFVGGLRKTTRANKVAAHFAKYGQVDSVDIKRLPDGTSRGFAFVKFTDEESVQKALEAKDNHMIDNKWVGVRPHRGPHSGRFRRSPPTRRGWA